MITPAEIKELALKWWMPFLVSHVNNETFFPKQIDRIGKVKPGDITGRYELLQSQIENLYAVSKNAVGTGYLVKTVDRNFRRSGAHQLPDVIEFETLDDYLHYVGKKKDWVRFQENYKLLINYFPQLHEWILENILLLCYSDTKWNDIIKVCCYFLANPRPDLYIRQLPIQVHTKFIEENSTLIQSLLDFLIPGHIRNSGKNNFAQRYFLKHDEPLIRIRILDAKLVVYNAVEDISIRLSDFEKNAWPCNKVLITENKMNFLALPSIPDAIAIWSGGGFNVDYFKNVTWLNSKKIVYWGDIDEHGFQILHQIRNYYPHAKSIMMDKETFKTFQEFSVDGERNKFEKLSRLNEEESEIYNLLKSLTSKNRLEQEKILQQFSDMQLRNF